MTVLRVQVVIAWPHRCAQREVLLDEGATVADAVRQAALEGAEEAAGCGIFGLLAEAGTPLRDGDRVELLRPLQADPKEARRRRAQRQRGG
jgi:putative ubiquitin-RnfH superfamily antitoxin RatB of RatAB toxin-antitoxin module